MVFVNVQVAHPIFWNPGGNKPLEETPLKIQDPKIERLEKLKKLGDLVTTLVHLKHLKKMREEKLSHESTKSYLPLSNIEFCFQIPKVHHNHFNFYFIKVKLDIPGMDQLETLPMDMEDSTSLASTNIGPEWQEIFERERAEDAAGGVEVKSELGGDCGGGQGSQSTNLHQPVAPNLALEMTEVKHSNEVEADTTTGDGTSMEVEVPQDTLPSAATSPEIAEHKSNDTTPTATAEAVEVTSAQETGKAGEQEKCKIPEKVDLMSALTFSNGRSLEAVKADTWISQSESKHRVRKVKENRRKELEQEPVAPLAKPESWGKVETVSPADQCPPKKKGRKPKNTEHAEEKQDVEETTSRKRKNKGSKSKKTNEKEMQPDPTAKRAKVEVKGSSDPGLTPSQRTGAYLRAQKKRKPNEAEEVAARPTKIRKGGKAEPENAAKKTNKGKASKAKGDGCTTAKGSRGKKEKTPEEVAARKAQLSRKSSAYHVAFRVAEGTLEERKEVAKKAPRRM